MNICSFQRGTLLVWIILGFKQVKFVSQLHNSKKVICHIMGGCGIKPAFIVLNLFVLATVKGN